MLLLAGLSTFLGIVALNVPVWFGQAPMDALPVFVAGLLSGSVVCGAVLAYTQTKAPSVSIASRAAEP